MTEWTNTLATDSCSGDIAVICTMISWLQKPCQLSVCWHVDLAAAATAAAQSREALLE